MTTEQEFFEAFNLQQVPITPEIVLKLIEILIKHNQYIIFEIQDKFMLWDGTIKYNRIGFGGDNIKDCVLLFCTNLQPEIQDQVRGIFNE